MADIETLDRLDRMESRVLRLEELLGVKAPPLPPKPRRAASAPPPLEHKEVPDFAIDEAEAPPTAAPVDSSQPPPIPPVLPTMPYRSLPAARPIAQSALEQTIGLKWAGWVGAVVLVIGAGLGIKFGYDQGWFSILPPAFRLAAFAVAGLGLIAAGEWVYRKVNRVSAAGLFGAGVAVLFVVSYAGHAFYDLYPRDAAFILMGISTILGALVARRGDMVSIAVLSLIGGNLAPALLSQGQPELAGFLTYLLMLQIVALTLAAWGATPKWWTLRGLSLATTSLWIAAVMDQGDHSVLIPFTIAFASLYQLELLISAARSRLIPPRAGSTFSMLVTAAFVAVMLYCMRGSSQPTRLMFVLATAGLAGVASFWCHRSAKHRAAFGELGIGYAIQFLALLAVAVPVAFSGIWIACAWGVLAIALAVLGYALDLSVARYAGPAIWILALAELSIWSIGLHHDRLIGFSIAGIDFYQHTMMNCLLALLGQVIAALMICRRNIPATNSAKQTGVAMSLLSSGVWVMAALIGLPPMIATAVVLLYAAGLALADFAVIDLGLLAQSATLTALTTVKWAFMDLLAHRMLDPQVVRSIFFSVSGFTACTVLIALAMLHFRASRATETNRHSRQIKQMADVLVVGVFFFLGTFGIDQAFTNLHAAVVLSDPDRAEQVALSIFWSVFAIALIAAGFGWRIAGLRYAGLGLFALTLLKVVAIDLSQVSTGYRIMSFMGLGILLLGTSVLYGKVSPILLAKAEERTAPD